MNQAHLDDFTHLLALGRRPQAARAIRAFAASFAGLEEKREWSERYLDDQKHDRPIRHELYESVIFPCLLAGYRQADPWSLRWLARTSQNLYRCHKLWRQVELKSEFSFLTALRALCPEDEETRLALLACHLDAMAYALHEWPAGILHGHDGATLEACAHIGQDLVDARQLDKENRHAEFFLDFEDKLAGYVRRLSLRQTGK